MISAFFSAAGKTAWDDDAPGADTCLAATVLLQTGHSGSEVRGSEVRGSEGQKVRGSEAHGGHWV